MPIWSIPLVCVLVLLALRPISLAGLVWLAVLVRSASSVPAPAGAAALLMPVAALGSVAPVRSAWSGPESLLFAWPSACSAG